MVVINKQNQGPWSPCDEFGVNLHQMAFGIEFTDTCTLMGQSEN